MFIIFKDFVILTKDVSLDHESPVGPAGKRIRITQGLKSRICSYNAIESVAISFFEYILSKGFFQDG